MQTSPFPISDTCDYCGDYVKSPYSWRHEDVYYSGHKRCMGAPMLRKLTQPKLATLPPIGICGKLRSGKNTAADYLTERYGYSQFAFGDELKRLAHEIYDVPTEPKPRELYQWFGQTMRERDPNVWVRKCFENIAKVSIMYRADTEYYGEPYKPLIPVIVDARQPNEIDRCRAEGYVIIRIVRPDSERLAVATATDAFNSDDLHHDTESHVDGFDVNYVIVNDGTLADMYAKIDAIMAEVNVK